MNIDQAILKRLELEKVTESTLGRYLDHFPPLIIDRCVSNSAKAIVRNITSVYASGVTIPAETITMPRKGYGPRPVRMSTPSARILYTALTETIAEALASPSRAPGNYQLHRRFGLEGGPNYIVDLDIAACYEYIDHAILRTELVLRSMDLPVCAALTGYLTEIMGHTKGLPQMFNASDRLADTYLSIMDRQLSRKGYESSRYVDDIRIIAGSWETANTVIEEVAEYARELGLTLSPEKTLIYKQATLVDQDREDADFYNAHFADAKASMTQVIFVGGIYDEAEIVEVDPDDREAAQAAAWDILLEWQHALKNSDGNSPPVAPLTRFIGRGLVTLHSAPDRLPDGLLRDIVFESPVKTEQVVRYLVARSDKPLWNEHLKSVAALAEMGRQSAWAKLWLLHAAEILDVVSIDRPEELIRWLVHQLSDRHEIVRAQAAWVCSTMGLLSSEWATYLYASASPITQPAIAAAVARQAGITESIRRGIEGDSPLNREAVKWVDDTTS